MKIFARIRHAQLIFSTAFYVAFYVIMVSFNRKYVIKLRKWVSLRILTANDIHIKVVGEPLNPEAEIFIANHQNMLDIMILEHIIPSDVCWVAKRELFKIPFYGRAVSIPDMIAVDRSNKLGMKLLIRTVKDRIAKGRPVVIFPEGTRSKKDEFLSFKSGAQFIANQLDLTVQPIVISNTKKLLRTAQSELYPSTITIQVMPSFKASEQKEKWLQDEKVKMQAVYNDIS